MNTLTFAHQTPRAWLASAINQNHDVECLRYIHIINGDAIATDGNRVHVVNNLNHANYPDGVYTPGLVAAPFVVTPAGFNPKLVSQKMMYLAGDMPEKKSLKDFKLTMMGTAVRLKKGGQQPFQTKMILDAVNNHLSCDFYLNNNKAQSFVFGANEYGTFFLLAMNNPTFKQRWQLFKIALLNRLHHIRNSKRKIKNS